MAKMIPYGNLEPVLDPRGKQVRGQLKLAPRVGADDLARGPILFYDNGKLAAGNYSEIFKRIKENLQTKGITNFIDFHEAIRGKSIQEIRELAARLARLGAIAAVVALGDMGVSPATAVLSIALEEQGLPTVYLTASPGHELARAVAFYQAGQLCLCPLDLYQGSMLRDIRTEVDRQMPCILESLTLSRDQIHKRSHLDFPVDKEPPAETGLLEIAPGSDSGPFSLPLEPGCHLEEVMDLFDSLYLGDGLPIVPPTLRRYKRMLSFCSFDPDMVLLSEVGPSGQDITVKDVAVAAVMAGCRPEYMPILITAFKAMAEPRYNIPQAVTTSHPGGNLILISGPIAREVGIHSGQGCLGPGFRANATIGRAVNLTLINVCRAVPAYSDLACLSSQAEYSYCFAEKAESSPWPPINVERYDDQTTCLMVLVAEPPHDLMDFQSQTGKSFLETVVDSCTTLGSNNAYLPGNLIIVLTPDHARLLGRDGFTKNMIREHIYTGAGYDISRLRNKGLPVIWPKAPDNTGRVPIARKPGDIEVVVAGGKGGHSAVILPWGLHSEAVVVPILLPNGKIARSIMDFKRKEAGTYCEEEA